MTAPPRGRAARVLLVLAGVAYASVLLEAVAGWPLDPAASFLSELAARDQPTSLVARLTDGLAGALALAGALLLLGPVVDARRTARALAAPLPSWLRGVAVGGLALFGLATVADAALPLDCALSLPACAAREAAGLVSASHHLHAVTSVVTGVGAMLAAASAAWLARPRPRRPARARDAARPDDAGPPEEPRHHDDARQGRAVVRVVHVAGVLVLLAGAVLTAWELLDPGLPVRPGEGVVQRVQVVATSVLLATCAAVVSPRRRTAAP